MSDLLTSERGQAMLGYVPPFYTDSRVMKALFQVEGAEFDELLLAITETLAQFFVKQADFSLGIWEKEFGLAEDASMTTAERQDRILSKMRVAGTATLPRIKAVAESFRRAKVHVVEDHAASAVIVRLVGLPTNIEDLKTAVQEIMPAHLGVTFEFGYLDWNRLDSYNWSWTTLNGINLTFAQLEVYVIA